LKDENSSISSSLHHQILSILIHTEKNKPDKFGFPGIPTIRTICVIR
jgi:hypothetical protein